MNLKQSKYNLVIEKFENGDILIFNSFSRAFGIMNKKCKKLYDRIFTLDESKLKDKDDILNLKIMKDNWFIINKNIDELELIKLREKIAKFKTSDTFSLTIAPTLNCNMACPYCFETKTNKRISDEVMNELIKFIERHLENRKYFFITWYGGEPLLEKQRIYDISEKVLKICKEKNVKYRASIITNGTLLDSITAKKLKEECNVYNAQITLDGYGEENNKRRLLKNGGDSFKIIIDNIDKAKEFLNIGIRINADKTNIDSALKLINFLIYTKKWDAKKNVTCYVAPVYNLTDRNNANTNICYSTNEFLSINSDIIDILLKNKLLINLERLIPSQRMVFCASTCLDNAYVVDPDGMLYTCWDTIGIKEHCVGDLKNGSKLNPEKIKWLNTEIPIECYSCKLLPLCLGGCPSFRLLNSYAKACNHVILNYKENLKKIYKYYENEKKLREQTKAI